jgi:hypothetical protein
MSTPATNPTTNSRDYRSFLATLTTGDISLPLISALVVSVGVGILFGYYVLNSGGTTTRQLTPAQATALQAEEKSINNILELSASSKAKEDKYKK